MLMVFVNGYCLTPGEDYVVSTPSIDMDMMRPKAGDVVQVVDTDADKRHVEHLVAGQSVVEVPWLSVEAKLEGA